MTGAFASANRGQRRTSYRDLSIYVLGSQATWITSKHLALGVADVGMRGVIS